MSPTRGSSPLSVFSEMYMGIRSLRRSNARFLTLRLPVPPLGAAGFDSLSLFPFALCWALWMNNA